MLFTSCITPMETRYIITFNSNGGTLIKEQIVNEGTQITIPSTPTKDGFVFSGWYSNILLTTDWDFSTSFEVNVMLYAKWIAITPTSSFTYKVINTTEIEVTDFIGSEVEVAIPDTIDGKPVTSIGLGAFFACNSLTSITIPDSVISVEGNAFSWCNNLTSIYVDTSNTFFVSVNGILFDYNKTTIITYPLGNDSETYGIPTGVTTIGDNVFAGCSSLTSITIPDSVTTIGKWVFKQCSSLTNITIPDSVTSIGDGAFSGCTSITNITIPDSVTSIGDKTFWSCTGLTSIIIPDRVASIGAYAFYDCDSLTSINCIATSQPAGWALDWNIGCSAIVTWGYTDG